MNKLRAATDTLKELALIYAVILFGCASLFMVIEHHSFFDSLYWAGTTATTVGYGDISPKSRAGEILALILMHLSVFGIGPMIIVRLVDRLNSNRDAFTHEEQVKIVEALARIEATLAAGAGGRTATAAANEPAPAPPPL